MSAAPHTPLRERVEARKIYAPFSPEQVKALNAWQASAAVHPFTCPGVHTSRGEVRLSATPGGWVCLQGCGYTQEWAHGFMTEPETLAHFEQWLKAEPDEVGETP